MINLIIKGITLLVVAIIIGVGFGGIVQSIINKSFSSLLWFLPFFGLSTIYYFLRKKHKHATSPLRSKRKKKVKNAKKYSLRNAVLQLFFNLRYLAYLAIFSICTAGSLWVSYNQKWNFAITSKLFDVADSFITNPTSLLLQKFTCSLSTSSWSFCGYDGIFIALLLVFSVAFSLWVIYKLRRVVAKRFLLIFLLIQQAYPVIIFALYSYVPTYVIFGLTKQANQEIITSIDILSSSEERSKVGIIESIQGISEAIEKELAIPAFFEYDPVTEVVLQYKKISHTDKDTLYRSVIIPSLLYASESASLKEKVKFEVLLFPSHTLISNNPSNITIEKLSIVLASKLLDSNYKDYLNKSLKKPIVSFLPVDEYILVQKKKEKEIENSLLYGIQDVRNTIKEIDNSIIDLKNAISASDGEYRKYESYGKGWISACESNLGKDESICREGKQTIENSLRQIISDKNQSESYLKEYIDVRPKWNLNLAAWQRSYSNFLKDPVTPEIQAGVFDSPNNIYIKLYPGQEYRMSYYIHTLLHEMLHFRTYYSERSYPKFLNEGITDFLTSELLAKLLKSQSLIFSNPKYDGYPELLEVVSLLANRFPKEEIIESYFNKKESIVKDLFVKQYGKGIYEQVQKNGDQIYYTSDEDSEDILTIIKDIKLLLTTEPASKSSELNSK